MSLPHTTTSKIGRQSEASGASSRSARRKSSCISRIPVSNGQSNRTLEVGNESQRRMDAIQSATDFLGVFFATYPDFNYDSTKPATDEFRRLSVFSGWGKRNRERQEAREDFQYALVKEFNEIYGSNENSISSWQGLCRALGIVPPQHLNECRKLIKETHVNLVDLVHLRHSNHKITLTLFPTEADLSRYSKKTGKIFPKTHTQGGGLLKHLLRQINNPPGGKSGGGRRRRRKRAKKRVKNGEP